MIYLETKFWFLIKELLVLLVPDCLLTITTLHVRDILHYACNGCNLWQAKKGLPKFYFRQPLGNPSYSSPNLATLAATSHFHVGKWKIRRAFLEIEMLKPSDGSAPLKLELMIRSRPNIMKYLL